MWAEAHRTRHEAGLKEMVSACAVEEMARWLERADPPRSEKATPVLPVAGAIAWHLRVGRPWRALPGGFPAWRTVQGKTLEGWLQEGEMTASPDNTIVAQQPHAPRAVDALLVAHASRLRLPPTALIRRLAVAASAPVLMTGCSTAPAQNIMGSFFPAWLLCAAIGCGAAAGFRLVLGALAVHDHVIFPLLTYLATALAVAMLIWLIWFGH